MQLQLPPIAAKQKSIAAGTKIGPLHVQVLCEDGSVAGNSLLQICTCTANLLMHQTKSHYHAQLHDQNTYTFVDLQQECRVAGKYTLEVFLELKELPYSQVLSKGNRSLSAQLEWDVVPAEAHHLQFEPSDFQLPSVTNVAGSVVVVV